MNHTPYTFIANWKMSCSFQQAKQLAQLYCDNYDSLHNAQIIICPSFDALATCSQIVKNSPIKLGAQTVSSYSSGPHTGQISAQSLSEIECTYAIIGHSERRQEFHETDKEIAEQAKQLMHYGISPIICIGEMEDAYKAGQTLPVLEGQLELILPVLQAHPRVHSLIAYEPVWAIGTGVLPPLGYLKTTFTKLNQYLKMNFSTRHHTLLYGGSVSETTILSLRSIEEIQGFLIGSASLDFKKFQNIVSLWYTK